MFLFEHQQFGTVLHTGDFRHSLGQRYPEIEKKAVDHLFLDNTFFHPRFHFPPREYSVGQIVRIIKAYPNHAIAISVDTFGKEELLVALARALNCQIAIRLVQRCTSTCIYAHELQRLPFLPFTADNIFSNVVVSRPDRMQLMIDLGLMENPQETNKTENEGGTVTLSNGHCCVDKMSGTSENQTTQKRKLTQQHDRRASCDMLDSTNCNGANSPIDISQQHLEHDTETNGDAEKGSLLLATRSLASPEPPPAISPPPLSSSVESATAALHAAATSDSKGVMKQEPEKKEAAVIGSDVFSTDLNTSRIRVVMR
jgi:hypothetical protein